MPAIVNVKTKPLASYLKTVALVMPKGTNTIPLGITLQNNKFSIVSDAGGIYTEMSEVVASKDACQVTCLYCDMASLLSGEETEFEIDQYGVIMRGPGYETTFPIAYSSIERIDKSDVSFKQVHDNGYIDSLKTILRINPEKLFSSVHPVTVYGDISLLKYPSMYVQARTMSLPFTAVFDLSHIRIITAMCPTEVSTDFSDSALFKRDSVLVQLPCKYLVEENNFLSMLSDMESASLVDITDHQNRLRDSVKFKGHLSCKIAIYPNGLRTTITTENASIAVLTGETTREPILTCTFPYQVWIAILTALGQGQVQILTGGQKLCLRTQSLAILTSVIL